MSHQIDGWTQGHDEPMGIETLTRCVDPANNTDKYRRFIVLWNPNNKAEKILITQTGRWTDRTARGIWDGGTYRIARKLTAAWERKEAPIFALNEHVKRKLGNYSVEPSHKGQPTSAANVRLAIARIKEDTPSATPIPPSAQPGPGSLASRPELMSPYPGQVEWLMLAAGDATVDQFDALAAYAEIKKLVDRHKAQADKAVDDLQTALNLIMLKG